MIRFSLFIAVLVCFACDPAEVDVTIPQIANLNITPTPNAAIVCGSTENQAIQIVGGETLQFDALFSDDTELSQYKVDIHSNFDCHGHGDNAAPSVASPDISGQTEDWAILEINDLTGTSEDISREFSAPENITAGNYHFQIQVVDAAGNDDPLANIYIIQVMNPADMISPSMEVTLPSESSFSATKGSMIQFEGRVQDETSLSEGGNGVLFLAYTNLRTGNTFNTDAVFPFDEGVSNTYDFNFEWQVPNTLTAGKYLLTVGATDGVRNVANFVSFEVEVE